MHLPGRLLCVLLLLALADSASHAQPVGEATGTSRSLAAVTARHHIVSTAHPLASAAGDAILDKGGSSVDAAIAIQLVLTLVEPQSSGIGGGGFLLHRDARSGAITSFDGRETAPASATPSLFMDEMGNPLPFAQAYAGGRSVGVPGMVAMMALAHRKHGRLPWRTLFKPAIQLAEEGFAVSPRLEQMLASAAERMRPFAATRSAYLDEAGHPLKAGAILRLPAYAATLRTLARNGPEAFYKGPIAAQTAEAVNSAPVAPVPFTAADLAAYKAEERPPVCGAYRAWRLCSMGPPSSGGLAVLMTLAMLERFDLKTLGPDSPTAFHLIGQAMALAFADRDVHVADPAFHPVPVSAMLDPAYLRQRSALIDPARALTGITTGLPTPVRQAAHIGVDVPSTSHFVVIDRRGNVVTDTGTIQAPFGSFISTGGFLLNNELTDFSFLPERDGATVANRVQPGKRPRSSMAPVIVTDSEGRFVMALGSAGGSRIIAHVIKTLIASLDWGMDMQQAAAFPNLFNDGKGLELEQGSILEAMTPALTALGNTVTLRSAVSGIHGVRALRNPEGRLTGYEGGADPRREGVVMAD